MKNLSKCILVLAMFLVGCSESVSGIIVEKNFISEHRESRMVCIRFCTTRSHWVGDEWFFVIRDESHTNLLNLEVTEEQYNQYKIGDYFEEYNEK